MDPNLGATVNTLSVTERGLFYQWRRKDSFPTTDALLSNGDFGINTT